MSRRWDDYFMDVSIHTSKLSYARRTMVGAVAVKDRRIIACGYNGTPPGEPNECERVLEILPDQYDTGFQVGTKEDIEAIWKLGFKWYENLGFAKLETLPSVVHAEANLVAFSEKNEIDLKGCLLYVTHSPCKSCAGIIIKAGFSEVIFKDPYRAVEGIKHLENNGVRVISYDIIK